MALLRKALAALVVAAGVDAIDECTDGNATCRRHLSALPSEQVLLQRERLVARPSYTKDHSERLGCSTSEVSRRRRQDSMCSCRRRSGPTCQSDKVVLEGSAQDAVKVMSYNLFGWNAFNVNDWRKEHVMSKITAWDPAVLGAQEVEKGGWGYEEVRDDVVATTGLEHVGGSQFHKTSVVEQFETEWADLVGGYWASMTRYRHKKSQAYFLFFNSHWKHGHGHGLEQAKLVADFVHEQRKKYSSAPAILVGDTNQFCQGHDSDAWKYLLGQSGSSPVVFEDAMEHDEGKSFSGGCRVDLIFVSKGDWSVRQADIDRDGMGTDNHASDHAPLMAELVPLR